MIRCLMLTFGALLAAATASAQHAVQVVSYDPGATPAAGYAAPASALGEPSRDNPPDPFDPTAPTAITPFNPPWPTADLVSIGEGGQLTLRLSHFVLPQPGGPEIGVFTNAGIVDDQWPDGVAGVGDDFTPFGVDSATVEVSGDGAAWVSLGEIEFNNPSAGYADTAFTMLSDYTQPFSGVFDNFEGLTLSQALTLLGGSGGGMWLDISATGLSEVGYVRFSVGDDLIAENGLNFELDAVSIASAAMGRATVPEPTALALLLLASLGLTTRRHA